MKIPIPGQSVRGSKSGKAIMALFDLLGRTWAMGIVWQLREGPFTFRELQARCDNVSPTLLNKRLKELRHVRLVELSPEGYCLTKLGEELFEVLTSFEQWSKKWAKALRTPDKS